METVACLEKKLTRIEKRKTENVMIMSTQESKDQAETGEGNTSSSRSIQYCRRVADDATNLRTKDG